MINDTSIDRTRPVECCRPIKSSSETQWSPLNECFPVWWSTLNKLSYCGGRSMLRLGKGSVFDRHLERVITSEKKTRTKSKITVLFALHNTSMETKPQPEKAQKKEKIQQVDQLRYGSDREERKNPRPISQKRGHIRDLIYYFFYFFLFFYSYASNYFLVYSCDKAELSFGSGLVLEVFLFFGWVHVWIIPFPAWWPSLRPGMHGRWGMEGGKLTRLSYHLR
ncbi:hypothetical protein BDV24DRAFT_128527, partial [Aspergillus arachidicola]